MKKKVSLLLVVVMILTIFPYNSFADDYDKQLKEAIVKVKELFSIGSEYNEFSHTMSIDDGDVVFNLNWCDKKEKLANIEVSITSDGTIVGYEKWKPDYSEYKPRLPKISKDEGLKLSKDFIKEVSPKVIDKLKYIDDNNPLNVNSDSYNYSFVRMENGIPYYNNRVNISIDNSTGEVKNYYTNWNMNLIFEDEENIKSLEDAQKLYKEKIGLDLLYKTTYEDNSTKLFLAYSPLEIDLCINAKDGEVISLYDYYNIYDEFECKEDSKGSSKGELNPDEQQAIEDMSGLISKKEAEKVCRDILELDSKYKLENIGLYENHRKNNEYFWEMYFLNDMDLNNNYYVSISIDAKTKELNSFYYDLPIESDKKVQYNEEKSLKVAEEYIKKMSPDKFELMELKKNYENIKGLKEQKKQAKKYLFDFIRKDGDSYVDEDGVSITVDATNGKISNYKIDWIDEKLPSRDNVISKGEALDILFNDIGLELKYITPERDGRNVNKNKKAILVYGLKSFKPAIIDANSGKILDYKGEEYKLLSPIIYNDIDNSYAKDKINILSQYGISLPSGEFEPKEKINQKDFLYLLAKAKYPYIKIDQSKDSLYTYLINEGIVKEDEKSPDSIVTKEEGVKYIIRALEYDKIADLSGIYKDIFKDTEDITPELKGYLSIAYGLKVIEGYDGFLNPKAELKREDGANIIYNYLFNGM